jgi:hypothetical protein
VIFLNFFAGSKKKFALGKEIFVMCFFFAESFLFGSRQRSLCAECFFCAESFLFGSRQSLLCRELFILLSAQKRTLGKASDSGSDNHCNCFRVLRGFGLLLLDW